MNFCHVLDPVTPLSDALRTDLTLKRLKYKKIDKNRHDCITVENLPHRCGFSRVSYV